MDRTMIAALALIGAASFAALPASAQDYTKRSAIPQQQAGTPSSGVAPSQSAFAKAAPSGLTTATPQPTVDNDNALTPTKK